MKLFLIAFVLAGTLLAAPFPVQARPRGGQGGQVVHSRRAPVIMHKMVPPFRGQHVFESGR